MYKRTLLRGARGEGHRDAEFSRPYAPLAAVVSETVDAAQEMIVAHRVTTPPYVPYVPRAGTTTHARRCDLWQSHGAL